MTLFTKSQTSLKKTPLYREHLDAGARMVAFAGWLMPVQYEGILSEHGHCRRDTAIFDTSHMGEFLLEGPGACRDLDYIVTQSVAGMSEKTCRYGLMLNEQGGIIDDLIVYKVSQDQWMIVVNASCIEEKAGHIRKNISSRSTLTDVSGETGKIDVQGPGARGVLKRLIAGVEKLNYFTFDKFDFLSENCIISRTGYTGELGYEIYFPAARIRDLWKQLLSLPGVYPAGLGARDVLRCEMGYPLYGQDLSLRVSPLEAGLKAFIDFDKDFIGKNILLKQIQEGVKKKVVSFCADGRRAPRTHYKIFDGRGKEIGEVTSGTFSPSLQKGIGMGWVDRDADLEGTGFTVGEGRQRISVQLTKRPFYKKGSLKK